MSHLDVRAVLIDLLHKCLLLGMLILTLLEKDAEGCPHRAWVILCLLMLVQFLSLQVSMLLLPVAEGDCLPAYHDRAIHELRIDLFA